MSTDQRPPEKERNAEPEEPETADEPSTMQETPSKEVGPNVAETADDEHDDESNVEEELDALLGKLTRQKRSHFVSLTYAPGGTVNSGTVEGGQHVANQSGPTENARGMGVPSQEGPIFAQEVLEAQFGFAEPSWFPDALAGLDSRLLILTGEPGAGRRTAALNLLHRHSNSMKLRAVDSTVSLADWHPEDGDVRGYLVDGLSQPEQLLKSWMVNRLADRLQRAKARMVIVIPRTPQLESELRRETRLTLMACEPPPTRAVFDARFEARVPDPHERNRLIASLGEEALDELLAMKLVPAYVDELVEEIISERADGVTIRERLSFLAEQDVPDLIGNLRDSPFRLAFLLATSVFEGLDHRLVREEAERLLRLADGRLTSQLPGATDEEVSKDNPEFVFDDALEDLLHDIRASIQPREVHSTPGYSYSVEPVLFTRHGQGQAVLRYVWREYGRLSGLITDWLEQVSPKHELIEPVGDVMGMAARWGGGRKALAHIKPLAESDRRTSRQIAASAMGIAAQDPVIAGEVSYRLQGWSQARQYQLRSTVAYTCATRYGLSRPHHALRLLGHVMNVRDEESQHLVARAVMVALTSLFSFGNQATVIGQLHEWADGDGRRATVALETFTSLLRQVDWMSEQLSSGNDAGEQIVSLVHQALNNDEHFEPTRSALLDWCRAAPWREDLRLALEVLLSALSHGMQHGVLRLFHAIDRDEDPALACKAIARQSLQEWRDGTPTSRNERDSRQQGSTEP